MRTVFGRQNPQSSRQKCQAIIRTSYDPKADAMFVWFAPEGAKSASTAEVAPGIVLGYGAAGIVIGIEVLDVRERVSEQKNKAA